MCSQVEKNSIIHKLFFEKCVLFTTNTKTHSYKELKTYKKDIFLLIPIYSKPNKSYSENNEIAGRVI